MGLTDLKKIGLTEGELKIYDALLELGETTRTILAKKSGISPSKIYDVANRLLEKGIISSVKKNGILHFSAADPNQINVFLEQKEQEIQKEKSLVTQLLPTLLLKYQKTKEEADVEVFYGWEGMKTVYWHIARTLSKGDENFVFGASMGKNSKQADVFFSQYYPLVHKKKYKVKIIFNENVRGNKKRTGYYASTPPHEVRYLYRDTFTELNFYKDTVLFVMLLEKPIVIRVTSKEAAESFKKFFDTLWALAKP